MPKKKSWNGDVLLKFWQGKLAAYVRRKRIEADKKQTLGAAARKTISQIENKRGNPRLHTLIKLVDAINGDMSELFQGTVPRSFLTDHRGYHEMLEAILLSGDDDEIRLVLRVIGNGYEKVVRVQRPPANQK